MTCLAMGLGDMLAHDLLRLYEYHPGLFNTLLADGHFGLLTADLIFVPGLVSILAVVSAHKRLWVALSLAALVVALEAGARATGAFSYHGWRLWFSMIGFPILFAGIAGWTTLLERQGYTGLCRAVVLFAAATQAVEPWANLSTGIIGTWAIRLHLFAGSSPDHVFGMYALYQVPAVLLITLVVARRLSQAVWGYGIVAGGVWLWLSFIESMGILKHAVQWDPLWEAALLVLLTWFLTQLDELLERAESRPTFL